MTLILVSGIYCIHGDTKLPLHAPVSGLTPEEAHSLTERGFVFLRVSHALPEASATPSDLDAWFFNTFKGEAK